VRHSRADELADPVRRAALEVEVRVLDRRRSVPAGIEISAYRIVQEGLTNTLKHARASPIEVRLVYDDRQIDFRPNRLIPYA
jgi:signal transduction histidine kinase